MSDVEGKKVVKNGSTNRSESALSIFVETTPRLSPTSCTYRYSRFWASWALYYNGHATILKQLQADVVQSTWNVP